MTKIDPIIAVNDVDSSAKWYEDIFGFKNSSPKGHGFAVLKSETNEIVLCLHQWEMDDHPTMTDPSITPGNGLMLYFRTNNLDKIYKRAKNSGCRIEEDIHLNPRPNKKEFALRDPDGYFLTVSEYHEYGK
ncbi:MAG TPA: VOC family protein [Flavobacteriales bacterium]|nr:VOC family protein [Bacteroidota bacterium]HMU15327.1 VOC family protein [Flavobacteriales bacterium]HNE79987.1 VOC family protein [Flavobacteriales bacterium]